MSSQKRIGKTGVGDEVKEALCEVCMTNNHDNEINKKLICRCNRWVHKYCYSPEMVPKIICDTCKRGKGHKCDICGQQNGMLKEISEQKFVHILCALTSSKYRVKSYQSLTFEEVPRAQQQRTNHDLACFICEKKGERERELMRCSFDLCTNYAHANCILTSKFNEDQESYFIYNLLDKNGHAFIDKIQERFTSDPGCFSGLTLCTLLPKKMRYFVCHLHNDLPCLVWCHCNQQKEQQLILCEKCKRWSHVPCTDCRDTKLKFNCSGCRHDDIYVKAVTLPQLIYLMNRLQSSNLKNLKADDLKFLDRFPFKMSQAFWSLLKNDNKACFQIEKYYIIESLHSNKLDEDIESKQKLAEITYYLIRRQRKRINDLRRRDLEECFQTVPSLFEKDVRLISKCQNFLQELLASKQFSESEDKLCKLQTFITRLKQGKRTMRELAQDIQGIFKRATRDQSLKEALRTLKKRNFIGFLYSVEANQEELQKLLRSQEKLLKYSQNKKISEKEYSKLSQQLSKKGQVSSYFIEQLKSFRIVREYQQKHKLLVRYEKKIEADKATVRQVRLMMSKLIGRGVFIPDSSPFTIKAVEEIKYQVIKMKCLKGINNANLSASQAHQMLGKITLLLDKDGQIFNCLPQEKKLLLSFKASYNFRVALQNLLRKEQMLDSNFAEERNLSEELMNTADLVNAIIKFWQHGRHMGRHDHKMMLKELLTIAEQSQLTTLNVRDRECISSFAENLLTEINSDQQRYYKGSELKQFCRVVDAYSLQNKFSQLRARRQKYEQWRKQLSVESGRIGEVLQNQGKVADLLQLSEQKLKEASLLPVDLKQETNRIKTMRTWCLLSLKYLRADNKKMTISAVQHLKCLVDEINYPNNSIKMEILQLDAEARPFKKKIDRFLEKPKMQEEIHEEYRVMASKMIIKEAEQLRAELLASSLNVAVELQELEEEIRIFRTLSSELSVQIESATSEQLHALRRRIFDSPFRYQNPDDYERLLSKIAKQKCIEGPLESRKEFSRLLAQGGFGAVELMNRNQQAYKVQQEIEKAERELISMHRVKQEHLLPSDSKKIMVDLPNNFMHRPYLQRVYELMRQLKDRFERLKRNKETEAKYYQLLEEFARLPVNHREIIEEVQAMTREIEDLEESAKKYLININYRNRLYEDIVSRYRSCGMRSQQLDRFERVSCAYHQITELGNMINKDNYYKFHVKCEEAVELHSHNQINALRERCFLAIHKVCETSSDSEFNVWKILLCEGSHLCHWKSKNQEDNKILDYLFEINNRIRRLEHSLEREQSALEEEDESPQSSQGLDGMSDEYEGDRRHGQDSSKKRIRSNEVVDIDD